MPEPYRQFDSSADESLAPRAPQPIALEEVASPGRFFTPQPNPEHLLEHGIVTNTGALLAYQDAQEAHRILASCVEADPDNAEMAEGLVELRCALTAMDWVGGRNSTSVRGENAEADLTESVQGLLNDMSLEAAA